MKTLGIIGGLSPQSTIDYYRSIVELSRERAGDSPYPHLIINSIDLQTVFRLVGENRLPELTDFLLDGVEALARAGAEIGLLSANMPHLVFEPLAARSSLPLISIVRVTVDAARNLGVRRPALLGTKFTMISGFYQRAFAGTGIDVIIPRPDEQIAIHDIYVNELINGVFAPQSREQILSIIGAMRQRDEIDSVILAGTELPLLLRGHETGGLTFLDTTRIHVTAAVEAIFSDS